MAERQRKRRHLLEPEAPRDRPHRYRGEEIAIKPTLYAVCAICFWSHATISLNDNAYHKPCLDSLKREFHPVPAQLDKEGKA